MTPEQKLAFAAPYIQASLERSNPSGNTLEDVFRDVISGHAALLLGQNSAVVTQQIVSQRIWHGGGDMPDMIATMQRVWPSMVAAGVQELRIEDTRKGWAKQLRPHGFEQVMALVKEA